MASKVSTNSTSNNQPKVETSKEEPKIEVKDSIPAQVETKPAESIPAEVKPVEENPAVEPAKVDAKEENSATQPAKVEASEEKPSETKAEQRNKAPLDTKEYKPIELKPFQTHPKVVVPEELELEP